DLCGEAIPVCPAEIRRRLLELAASNSSRVHIEQLLLELKAQEAKNQLALDALRDQIGNLPAPLDAGCQEPDSVLVPLRALHLAYLQGGGSDPAVLAQMYDLQVEATALERAAGRQEHKERKKSKSLPPLGLGIAERMQPRWAGRRSPPMLPPPVAPPLPPPPFPIQGCSCSAEGSPHLSLCLLSLPHRAGFVIFYDFLLGLDPTFSQVCLVAGLYRNGQKMGKPTPLPVAYCQMGQSPLYVVDGQRDNSAILSAKQPVPRVRPSTSIALVMELQASGGFDAYGQEIQRLASRGWAKIHLFDQLHQLISGRWKIPVRLLPVQPGLTTEQLNGTPQAGKTELYLRVVNARDADMQSMAEIDPGKATMYQYPPTVSRSFLLGTAELKVGAWYFGGHFDIRLR
uniref:Coiled-coil domain containing 17 n=1 Tax=Gopherus agassizii TaxID=38772 RepID=A0A452I2P2_9SAUR